MTETPANPFTRWALKLEFDGSGMVGWQRQAHGLSVQVLLEGAAARLTSGGAVRSATAGRTDAGVHAAGLVVHLDLSADYAFAPHHLRDGLSYYLKPHRIAVLSVARVDPPWHARFSALGRAYRYTILNRVTRPALDLGHVWHIRHPLNIDDMNAAARSLLGEHDFTSFRAVACQAKSPIKTLDTLLVERRDDYVVITAKARSFLHHQVRNMVGSLQLVGRGAWPRDRFTQVLSARDRCKAGPTAPPEGLCFMAVTYPKDPFNT